MTNEEKARELSYWHCHESSCGAYECKNCPKAKIDDAVIQMAEWKDKQYKVLIDYIVEFLNDSWYDCETFSECMPEWCEKNCGSHNPNFNAECIKSWIKKQNEIKK